MSGVHARLSASSAHRWLACPGSVGGKGGAPSIYSATGTFAHDIAAKCLLNNAPASDFLCKRAKVDGFDVECDLEMVDGVQLYIDAIDSDRVPSDKTWVEMPLLKALRRIDPDLGGTADFVRYRASDKTLRVWDFKYGSGTYVEAESNEQMMIYAMGAMLECGEPVEQVAVTIVQPRFEGAAPERSWVFDAPDILDFVADVKAAAARSREKDAPLAAGDHCKFCPKAASCPELEKKRHAVMAAEFADVSALTPERVAAALADIPLLKGRITAIEEYAYAQATAGVEIPGYKLVDKRPVRKWKSEGDVIMWAQAVAVDCYAPREVLSPAQLEKALAKDAPRGKKKEFVKVLEPFIEKVSSGTALVPVSDERPPAKVVTAVDFPLLPA